MVTRLKPGETERQTNYRLKPNKDRVGASTTEFTLVRAISGRGAVALHELTSGLAGFLVLSAFAAPPPEGVTAATCLAAR